MMVLIVWNLDLHSENIEDSYSGAFDKQFGDYYIAEDPSALWSFPSWPSHIDHILVTNELFGVYDVQTIAIDQLFFNSLTDYDNLIKSSAIFNNLIQKSTNKN